MSDLTPSTPSRMAASPDPGNLYLLADHIVAELKECSVIGNAARVMVWATGDILNYLSATLNAKLGRLVAVQITKASKGSESCSLMMRDTQITLHIFDRVLLSNKAEIDTLSLAEYCAAKMQNMPMPTSLGGGMIDLSVTDSLVDETEVELLMQGVAHYTVRAVTAVCLRDACAI